MPVDMTPSGVEPPRQGTATISGKPTKGRVSVKFPNGNSKRPTKGKVTKPVSKRQRQAQMYAEARQFGAFTRIANRIAKKQGISVEAAKAIVAKTSRNASPAAKKKNPALKKVKGSEPERQWPFNK